MDTRGEGKTICFTTSCTGFARKTAMDEAVRRFAAIYKPEVLILSLDADTFVAGNYFREIAHAAQTSRAACFTFQFRHNYDGRQ